MAVAVLSRCGAVRVFVCLSYFHRIGANENIMNLLPAHSLSHFIAISISMFCSFFPPHLSVLIFFAGKTRREKKFVRFRMNAHLTSNFIDNTDLDSSVCL